MTFCSILKEVVKFLLPKSSIVDKIILQYWSKSFMTRLGSDNYNYNFA